MPFKSRPLHAGAYAGAEKIGKITGCAAPPVDPHSAAAGFFFRCLYKSNDVLKLCSQSSWTSKIDGDRKRTTRFHPWTVSNPGLITPGLKYGLLIRLAEYKYNVSTWTGWAHLTFSLLFGYSGGEEESSENLLYATHLKGFFRFGLQN